VTTEEPLRGHRVLLPRPEQDSDDLVRRLEALGARVAARPTIAFERPSNPEPALRALGEIERYSLMVFTSARGVQSFGELAREAGIDPKRRRGRVAAIGPATARALEGIGLVADLVAPDGRAEGLADLLRGVDFRDRRVLVVRPEVARDVVPEALRRDGAQVDAVAFYRTVPAPTAGETAIEISEARFDAVVFTSPSTLLSLLRAKGSRREAVLRGLGRTARVAIGPVTAGALEEAGIPADAVADSPTPEAIVRALIRALRGRPGLC